MPAASSKAAASPVLLWGEDEFAVKQRARALFRQWCDEIGGMDHEIVDASVSNSGEALSSIGKLREALQTLPFFGHTKVVWFQNCNFLGDERAASTQAVTQTLGELAQEFKKFDWSAVRLLITAGKVDKRRTFYKTLEQLGKVEAFGGWSGDDSDWVGEAEGVASRQLADVGKQISPEALGRLVSYVGPNARQLNNEVEKLALFAGTRTVVSTEDVDAITTRNKQSRAFALGEALGDRDLPRLLRALDDELWEMKLDSQKSEIGILYGLISKIRALIFAKELVQRGWIKPAEEFYRFKSQLSRVPADQFAGDKRFNPLGLNPYVLFKAVNQARNYSQAELVAAMETLLDCNRRLIFSGLEGALVLQQSLVRIVSRSGSSG